MRQKIRSDKGVSMILALALMLVCVMVSSVIIAGAASGSSRNTRRLEQQQDYLAVSSGAQLIADNLKTVGSFVITEIEIIPECSKYQLYPTEITRLNGTGTKAYWVPQSIKPDTTECYIIGELEEESILSQTADTNTLKGEFAAIMKAAAKSVYESEKIYKETFYMSIPGEERLPKVKCDFYMNLNYNVKIEVASGEEPVATDYRITISMNAGQQPNVVTNSEKLNEDSEGYEALFPHTHEIQYKYYDAVREQWITTEETMEFNIEKRSTTTTIEWSAPVISKGVD